MYKIRKNALSYTVEEYGRIIRENIETVGKSREQFELSSYKRLLDIYSTTSKTIDALMKLELPSGVDVEIKAS